MSQTNQGPFKFKILVVGGPHLGSVFEFEKDAAVIGRGSDADVVLSLDPKASRKHAEIRLHSGKMIIVNLSSKTFVYLDGVAVTSENITMQSEILIGDSLLKAEWDPNLLPSAEPLKQPLAQIKLQGVAPRAPTPPQVALPKNDIGQFSSNAQQDPFRNVGQISNGPRRNAAQKKSQPLFMIIIVAVVLGGGYLFLDGNKKKKQKDANAIRSSAIIQSQQNELENTIENLRENALERKGSLTKRRASESFQKGFRDYQQGQYGRAIESFTIVTNLDPSDDLARTYLRLSQNKFDEVIKSNLLQGAKYASKSNWRMCKNSFNIVKVMLANRPEDPSFKEAKSGYEVCSLKLGES